jgi:hypothetical protein
MSRHGNTNLIEQEIDRFKPWFAELDKIGRQRQKENPHGIVEIPRRSQDRLARNSVLPLLNLFLQVQQDPNLRHPGISFVTQETFAIHNQDVNELFNYLIERGEKQGIAAREKIPTIFNKLARWHHSVKPYYDKFEVIREQGFKHPGIIRHYFHLDELDGSFAIYKTVGAALNVILEVVDPKSDRTTALDSVMPDATQRSDRLTWPVSVKIDAAKAKESFVRAIDKVRQLNENELKHGIAYHDTLAKIQLTGKIWDFYLNLDLDTNISFNLFQQKFNFLLNLRIKLGGNLIPCGDNDDLCEKIDKFLGVTQEFVNEVRRWREFLEEDVQGIGRQLGELQGLIVRYIKDDGDREQLEKEIQGYQSGIHAVKSSFQALGMLGGMVGSSSLVKVSMFGQQAIEIATMLTSLGVIKATAFAPLSVLGPYAAIAMAGMSIISMFTGGFSQDSSVMAAIKQQLEYIGDTLREIQNNQAIIIGNQQIIANYLLLIGRMLTDGLDELKNLIENKFLQLNDNLDRHFDELMLFLNKMKRGLYSRATANYLLETMKTVRFIMHYSANYPIPTASSRAALQERMATLASYDAPELVCHAMLTSGDEQEPDKFTPRTILEVLGRNDERLSGKLGYLADYYRTMIDPGYDAGLVCNIDLWYQIVIAYAEGLFHLTHEQLPAEQAIDRIRDVGVRTENMILHMQLNGYTLFIDRLFSYLIANTDGIADLFKHLSAEQLKKAVARYRERLLQKREQIEVYYGQVERTPFDEPYKSAFLGQIATNINRLTVLYHEPAVEISPTLFNIYENEQHRTLLNPFFASVMAHIPSIFAEASFFGLGYFSGKIIVQRLPIIGKKRLDYRVELYYTAYSGGPEAVLASLKYRMTGKIKLTNIPHYPWNDESIRTELTSAPYVIDAEADFVKSTRAAVTRVISQLITDVISGREAGELYNLFLERIAAGMLLTGNFAQIVGLSNDYITAVREFDPERIQAAVYTYLAHAIKAGNGPIEYDLKAKLREIMAFVGKEPREVFSLVDPGMNIAFEQPEFGEPMLTYDKGLSLPLQTFLSENTTSPLQNLTSPLNATIQAALSQLEMAQTRVRIIQMEVEIGKEIANDTLPLPEPDPTPSPSIPSATPGATETERATEGSGHYTAWYAIAGVTGALITAVGLFLFLRNRKLGRNAEAGIAAAALIGSINVADARAVFDNDNMPLAHSSADTRSAMVLSGVSRGHSFSHESETTQATSHCQGALFFDQTPVLVCRSPGVDSLVFAASESSPAGLPSGAETTAGRADFTVDPDSCHAIEFAGRDTLACTGRSRNNQEAQYVFMPDITPPFAVQCCERLPGVLVLLQFGLEWYRNYTADSSELPMSREAAAEVPASRDAVETLRKQVMTLQEQLVTRRDTKQVQSLKFVLQEYLYTLEDWLSAQELPSQARVAEFKKDLEGTKEELHAMGGRVGRNATATCAMADDTQQFPRQAQSWTRLFSSSWRQPLALSAAHVVEIDVAPQQLGR